MTGLMMPKMMIRQFTLHGEDDYAGPWPDEDQDYYDVPTSADGVFDVEEFDEIYANYQEARGKLNAMRTARGFYPVVAMIPGSQPESPQNRKGKSSGSKGKQKGKQMPKGRRPPPDPRGRASAANVSTGSGKKLCLRCGAPGHLARNCPSQGGDRKRKAEDDDAAIHMVQMVSSDAVYKMDEDEDETSDDTAVQDGGAASVLGSARQIRRYLAYLMEKGFDIHSIPVFACEKGFKYGNSQREITTRCMMLPMFVGGRRIDVLTYVIKGEAPILIGRPLLEKLGLTVSYERKEMHWPGCDWESIPTGPKGEHTLHLGKDLSSWDGGEPDMVLMPDDVDRHVGDPVPMAQFLETGVEPVMADGSYFTEEPVHEKPEQGNTRPLDGMVEKEKENHSDVGGTVKRLHGHVLRKMEMKLQQDVQQLDKVLHVSKTLEKSRRRKRVIWEVFVGEGRVSKSLARRDDVMVEVFSLQTGWDFEQSAHRGSDVPLVVSVAGVDMCSVSRVQRELDC